MATMKSSTSNQFCFLAWLFLVPNASAFPIHRASKGLETTKLYSLETTGFVDIAENAPRDVTSFEDWATNAGIQRSEGFQMEYARKGRTDTVSMKTTQDLSANSPIVYIPGQLIWMASNARNAWYSEGAEEQLLQENNDRIAPFYLFLQVLKEYEMGAASPWFPWLDAMPRVYANGASMTDFCYGCLPPYAAALARQDRKYLEQFLVALNQLDSYFLSEATKSNTELTKWAFAVANTQSFELPNGDLALVPMADMFPHSSTPEAFFTLDEQGNGFVCASQDISAGSTIRLSYKGDPTNPSKLLARYGTFDETCPAQFCKLFIEQPSAEVVEMGYDPSRMLFYETGEISQEVWDIFLYQQLKNNREQQYALYQAHVSRDQATKQQLHEQYWPQTLEALRFHVDGLLFELFELSQMGWNKHSMRHPRLPLLLKHNEYVRDTFERVQDNLESMS